MAYFSWLIPGKSISKVERNGSVYSLLIYHSKKRESSPDRILLLEDRSTVAVTTMSDPTYISIVEKAKHSEHPFIFWGNYLLDHYSYHCSVCKEPTVHYPMGENHRPPLCPSCNLDVAYDYVEDLAVKYAKAIGPEGGLEGFFDEIGSLEEEQLLESSSSINPHVGGSDVSNQENLEAIKQQAFHGLISLSELYRQKPITELIAELQDGEVKAQMSQILFPGFHQMRSNYDSYFLHWGFEEKKRHLFSSPSSIASCPDEKSARDFLFKKRKNPIICKEESKGKILSLRTFGFLMLKDGSSFPVIIVMTGDNLTNLKEINFCKNQDTLLALPLAEWLPLLMKKPEQIFPMQCRSLVDISGLGHRYEWPSIKPEHLAQGKAFALTIPNIT
ncbi:hypothetical protein [Heliorestis convoluta]|uniref:Uncharacterized protein n=1 Tax=Heliorestis convoluta TaxID=356322 RepID=A0A5Q2N619_9FIRM|nr:hypothetical protein [Heliorestis convoluta]QGG48015.1 hypothetical protein FTV88_1917 [Heliorestis convoluta]